VDTKLSTYDIRSLTEVRMSTRRRYDKQFKIDAVQMWESSGKTMAEVARELGIAANRLHRWKDDLRVDPEKAFPGQGKPREEELARLRKEYADMKMERDILKKALAIFSKNENKNTNS
jgi:transposase